MEAYSISQTAERTGVPVTSLRYYEDAGLLPDVQRLPNGHRRYSALDLAWIEFISCLRDGDMPIAGIAEYVTLAARDGTEQARLNMLVEHARRLDDRIASLQTHRSHIADKIAWYRREVAADSHTTGATA